MSNKIIEQILEPTKIMCGSVFKLKIKAIRYMTYEEMKSLTVLNLKSYTVSSLKGE